MSKISPTSRIWTAWPSRVTVIVSPTCSPDWVKKLVGATASPGPLNQRPLDQRVAEPARVAVVADEWQRGEARDVDLGLADGDRMGGRGMALDGRRDRRGVRGRAGILTAWLDVAAGADRDRPAGAPTDSTRIGLATGRCRSSITRSSDQSSPSANVAAATPTTSAPRVIAARPGCARPADTPSRPGRPIGARSPSRRRRPPPGRVDGALPRVIASTALIRPARSAGTNAASPVVSRAIAATPTMTGIEMTSVTGTPNEAAVSWTTGWLATVPDRDADHRPDGGGHEDLPAEDRAHLARRVADGLHDADVAVAREDDAGDDVGDEERGRQQGEDREREQHRHVQVRELVDAGLDLEVGLALADGISRQAGDDRRGRPGQIGRRRRRRHPIEHLLVGPGPPVPVPRCPPGSSRRRRRGC